MAKPVRLLDGSRVIWEIIFLTLTTALLLILLTTFVGRESLKVIGAILLTIGVVFAAVRLTTATGAGPSRPTSLLVADQIPVGFLLLGAVLLGASIGGWPGFLGVPAVVIIAGAYTRTIIGRQKRGRPSSRQA